MGRTLGTHPGEVRMSQKRLPGTRDQPGPVRCTGSASRAQGFT